MQDSSNEFQYTHQTKAIIEHLESNMMAVLFWSRSIDFLISVDFKMSDKDVFVSSFVIHLFGRRSIYSLISVDFKMSDKNCFRLIIRHSRESSFFRFLENIQ